MSRKSYNVERVDSDKETKRIVTAELEERNKRKGCEVCTMWKFRINLEYHNEQIKITRKRNSNDELGLNTLEGIAQWYKKI